MKIIVIFIYKINTLNFRKMTKEQVLGIVRHVLTFGGGWLVTKGAIDEGLLVEIVGAVTTLAGAVWSVWAKKPQAA